MAEEGFCKIHGPYDARLKRCPYCHRQISGRPQPPSPLDDEAPTDPGARHYPAPPDDELPTDPRGGFFPSPPDDDDDLVTQPRGFGVGRPPIVGDDLVETRLPRRRRARRDLVDEDATRLYDEYSEAEGELLGWLIVRTGMRRGKVYPLQHGMTVGRANADIILRDTKMSRPHARFNIKQGQFVVHDLESANGTFVNGERIGGPTSLNQDDVIKMGETEFVLKTLE